MFLAWYVDSLTNSYLYFLSFPDTVVFVMIEQTSSETVTCNHPQVSFCLSTFKTVAVKKSRTLQKRHFTLSYASIACNAGFES